MFAKATRIIKSACDTLRSKGNTIAGGAVLGAALGGGYMYVAGRELGYKSSDGAIGTIAGAGVGAASGALAVAASRNKFAVGVMLTSAVVGYAAKVREEKAPHAPKARGSDKLGAYTAMLKQEREQQAQEAHVAHVLQR